jgi:hypothetical protein
VFPVTYGQTYKVQHCDSYNDNEAEENVLNAEEAEKEDTEHTGIAVTLWTCILVMLGLRPSRDTGYPAGLVPHTRPQPLPSNFQFISIILSFGYMT